MTAGAEHAGSQQAGPVGAGVGPGPYRSSMTTADTLALPSGTAAEDDFLDLVEEVGDRAIAQLLEECRVAGQGVGEDVAEIPVAAALEDLASALADALLDADLGAPRGISPHSLLRDHPDFPEVLGLRVLGALHLHDVLDRSAAAALMAGLLARRRMHDGETAEALKLAVLAASLGSTSSSPHTSLCLGVLAAALQRCGHRRQASGIHLLLHTSGVEIEAWRDPEKWETGAPWTDGARFEQWLSLSRGAERRVPLSDDDPRSALAGMVAKAGRLERFGLLRHQRRRREENPPLDLMLRELEDLAIQEEWEYL